MSKTRSLRVRQLVVSFIYGAALGAAALAAGRASAQGLDREAALRTFTENVADYAALHRRLEEALPPLTPTRNVLKTYVAQQLLASAIRKARPAARQGGIFTPEAAMLFRALIAETLDARRHEAFLAELDAEHPDVYQLTPVVNEPLPDRATHRMPVVLLAALPQLPEDLEYRIVSRDLVLWDIHANLVVDYVPSAIVPVDSTSR